MPAPTFRSFPQRRLVWLFWAALVLRIAQTATTWHALSVAHAGGSDVRGKPLLHPVHCDFCLTGAALSGGALPGGPPSSPHALGRHEAPRAISAGIRVLAPGLAY